MLHILKGWTTSGRVIAGLSAGAYGAVDIALRHPGLFGVAESWSGYFRPLRDGPLTHASAAELAAHDPTLLVRREAARLRHRVWASQRPDGGRYLRLQLPAALEYAIG